ncbi:NAD-dependent epimerase/dehydratase family protein [Anaeromyxobacter oryzae]|uniref:NAD-dependent epimerase n=1 Tax=Anaeromyxobacter oryzae TaxID=2918170 RepID=A0ABM7WVF6_9BACT|nr:NAD-dependent epimerase/dehydratase family protein [Anaeromyxobacter oryzae]BDG03452.1 NAD-dependent epimerase [Anaeromyxobacter oryzae]
MKVFVTGATGYVGGALVQALVRGGHEVTGLSRDGEKDGVVAKLGARPVRGALGELRALVRQMSEHDALVHAAMDYGLGPPADLEAIEAMLAAAGESGRTMQVVYTSGVWVLGETRTPAGEGSPLIRPAAAVAWRPPHERRVLESATDRLHTAVVRPGMVYGEKRGLVNMWFDSATKEGAARFVGTGAQRWALVHRSDLAELYRAIVEKGARGIFHGVDGASPAVSEAAAAASRAAGKGGAVKATPVEEARKTMGPMADAFAMDQVVISTRGVDVGWAPKHPPFVKDAENAYREWRG